MRLELGREGKRDLLLARIEIWFNKVYNHSTGTPELTSIAMLCNVGINRNTLKGRGYIPLGLLSVVVRVVLQNCCLERY